MFRTPVYQPDLSGKERDYVLECLDSTWISSKGHFIQDFERGFANYIGAPYAASVCNGTAALHLALLALGIGPDDEVIVPTFTYIASVNAIRYVGATPVFCDSLPGTWQLDPMDVERRISNRTRAVMAVHLYGGSCDMTELQAICSKHGLRLIEDCAEAIGTLLNELHVGNFGDVSTFSFFGNKTITTGEGGMVVCKDPALDLIIRKLRGQGLAQGTEYWHDVLGYNYRMTNICAAIGKAQLERVESIVSQKIQLAERYKAALKDTPVVFQQPTPGERSSSWMVTILTPKSADRDRLRSSLLAVGVETRPVFHLAHTMPMYSRTRASTPVALDISQRGMNLPSWHRLPDSEFDTIIKTIRSHPWTE